MGHREQNSTCPMTWEEEPRGFLTEWEATPMKPTEDAKMGNDEAERLARDCETAAWCLKGAGEFETGQATLTEAAALIRAQAARIADHVETLLKMEELAIARQARAEAAEAEVARLREAADRLEECSRYFATAFRGKNADKLLSAIAEYRAALQRKSGE